MLSPPSQPDPQRGEPLAEGLSTFALSLEGGGVPAPAPRQNQSWRLLLITLMSCFAASGAALGAFFWLINLPPTANCDNTTTVTTDRAQLFCAQTAAASGELSDVLAALDLTSGWSTEHPLYYEVQPLIEQWSRVVLTAAEQELRTQGSMAEAQGLVSHIPPHSSVFTSAQETMGRWQSEWDQGEAIMATAQAALEQTDWVTASKQMQALAELKNSHWRVDQVQALSRQIRQERRAQDLLSEAIATAALGGSDRLGSALRTASQIDEGTYARGHAQPYLNRWSDLLLTLGLDKWYASDLNAAIALGRSAALNPDRAKPAQELIWLTQSRQLAQQSLVTWRTSPDQLVSLYRAMLMANRVPQDSPYYGQAQSSIATWRGHLGDLAQFQTAQAVGAVRDIDALKVAIGQAETVPLGHPRRVQAQTMVAHWRQEIERLEDRPQLVKAHGLAQGKTLDGLREAIQTANAIPLHRALRGEAQSWAYVWTNEIQVIEDRPMLERARSLAAQGNLFQAIAEASGVKSGRALHGEARAAIANWQRQIAAAEQARQRALERAAAPIPEAVDPDPETPDSASDPAEYIDPTADAASLESPSSTDLRQWRSPLPDRLETIPGVASPADPPAPITPAAPQPSADPTPANTAPLETPPPTAPMPIPAAAPSPVLVVPPAPLPVDLAPVPAAGEPQAMQPAVPAISAQPHPEAAVGLKFNVAKPLVQHQQ